MDCKIAEELSQEALLQEQEEYKRRSAVRKILEEVPEEVLLQDLESYRKRAIDLGASDAVIITTDKVVIDERVRAKCLYPKCENYGTSAHCPPYAMDLEQTRKLVSRFKYAIFFRLKVPTEVLAGRQDPDAPNKRRLIFKARQKILGRIESEAFYDGYYLSVAFGGGCCKRLYCLDQECSALKPGQACRAALHARAAMESVGMDVYRMAASVGWDIYPIGFAPSDAPHGTMAGIVFIY
jgi:predicted metal-binding protein